MQYHIIFLSQLAYDSASIDKYWLQSCLHVYLSSCIVPKLNPDIDKQSPAVIPQSMLIFIHELTHSHICFYQYLNIHAYVVSIFDT